MFLQNPHHPYHNLLRNCEDLGLILKQSNYSVLQYQQLIEVLQEKILRKQEDDLQDNLRKINKEFLEQMSVHSDYFISLNIAGFRLFLDEISFLEVKEEKSPSSAYSVPTSGPVSSLSFSPSIFSATTQNHVINSPSAPATGGTWPNFQNLPRNVPWTPPNNKSSESYRIVFQYRRYRIQLECDLTQRGSDRYLKQVILLSERSPTNAFIRESSVDLARLVAILDIENLSAEWLNRLFSSWFRIFDLTESVEFL